MAASFLLYGQLLVYGFWVAMGVVEEKSSRVVEVLLAAIPPRALIAGKIIGLGLLGLAQFALLGVVGLAIAAATGAIELDSTKVGILAIVLVWFLLGFALYAGLFAMAGVLVSRQEDVQSTTTPLTIAISPVVPAGLPGPRRPVGRAREASPRWCRSRRPWSCPAASPWARPAPAEIALSLVLLVGTIAAAGAAGGAGLRGRGAAHGPAAEAGRGLAGRAILTTQGPRRSIVQRLGSPGSAGV